MKIFTSVEELIGHTPMLEAEKHPARILAKLEYRNPAGSVKDRASLEMLKTAPLHPDTVIIEPTSGNTGIALAALAAARGLKCIIVMPQTMSIERQALIKAYGAQVILTPGGLGMAGAIRKAKDLAAGIPHSFLPGQFDNPANPQAHYAATGPEIWQDIQGQMDIFVAGVGTGGTLSGVGRFLKEQNPDIFVVAVEPEGSPVLSGGTAGRHGIQGIGPGFRPENLELSVVNEILRVSDEEAISAARNFARTHGLLVGPSSGAALAAARRLAARPGNAGKTVVTVFPDSGERYLSTGMFTDL